MKRTPVFSRHTALGGRMVDFATWELPVQYSGIIAEHEAVRTAAGLFDVSHMGEIAIRGAGALDLVQHLVTGDVAKLRDRQVLYSMLCYEDGGVVDDLLVYRHSATDFLLVVNASNTDKDFAWIRGHASSDTEVANVSASFAQLALQGPRAQDILQQLTHFPLAAIPFFCFEPQVSLSNTSVLISRTGYTGEDGFEIYLASDDAPTLWDAILHAGQAYGIVPAGLGARDTLRFEAGLPLYGHELDQDISPLEANLGPFVKLKKQATFLGQRALQIQSETGIPRELVGISMTDRGIPRPGCAVMKGHVKVGHITSGTYSPTRKENLGLALVVRSSVGVGEELSVIVRGKPLLAQRITLPFYSKRYRSNKGT